MPHLMRRKFSYLGSGLKSLAFYLYDSITAAVAGEHFDKAISHQILAGYPITT
jgi:hypothetical protein